MDLIQLETEDASKSPVKHAKLEWVGKNNHRFGEEGVDEVIGSVVEVHHVLPHTDNHISHPDNVHAIVKFEGDEKTSFELDLKLNFEVGRK